MKRGLKWGAVLSAGTLTAFWIFQERFNDSVVLFDPPIRHIETAPLSPWRNPENDLKKFFPNASAHVVETRILSSHRVELAELLGRLPQPDENTLVQYRILAESESVGFVLVRRVKGEHGAIEVVLALNPRGEVRDIAIQRMREPEVIAGQLRDPSWLETFRGRDYKRGWDADDLCRISAEARSSALAVREAIRTLLICHAVAESVPN